MTLLRKEGFCAGIVLLALGMAGCRSTDHCCPAPYSAAPTNQTSAGANNPVDRASSSGASGTVAGLPSISSSTGGQAAGKTGHLTAARPLATSPLESAESNRMRTASYRLPAPAPSDASLASDALFAGQAELSLAQLVEQVQNRNPSLQAMAYAWRAAAQRYPQAVSLDDPMFMTMMAPASFGSSRVESAYVLQGSQKLPWFGKRQTRGQVAQAEAGAAFQDVQDTRLQIVQVTRLAFYDYYLAERQLEINEQNRQSAQEFRDTAQVKYENNQVEQQDVIQADVELADIRRRKIEVGRTRRVAVARINVLLLRTPDDPLPPSPESLAPGFELPPADSLRQTAMARRPDLAALAARVRSEQAAVDLALKQYYPDAEVFGRYDSFWQPASTQSDLRGQVGVNMNVPIYRRRLNAAVSESQFRLSQRRAEYQQRLVEIQYEVQAAYEQVEEARQTVELYTNQYLPFAEQNLALARANYDVGKTTYLNLVIAQRQLFAVRETYEQTLTDFYRRIADIERAIGGTLSEPGRPEDLPLPSAQ
ncbi:MAG: TolC family protein [Planctomycetia bacterium]|nr:TolC family protein [Planctomycetia bacterium]